MQSRDVYLYGTWGDCRYSTAYHVVLSDGKLIYEGSDIEKMREAFWFAGRSEARRVSHLVNGVEMVFSCLLSEISG